MNPLPLEFDRRAGELTKLTFFGHFTHLELVLVSGIEPDRGQPSAAKSL